MFESTVELIVSQGQEIDTGVYLPGRGPNLGVQIVRNEEPGISRGQSL